MVEEQRQRGASSPHVWVSTSYFAEGFPYSVVHQLAEVLFKESGASLQAIGLTSLFHLPWNLKFLWGPLLDAFSTKRQWLGSVEIAITGVIVALAAATQASNVLAISSVLFIALALLAATHDIAIDGYYLEALDESGQSRFVGYRAAAYRIAMMVVAGPLLWCISRSGWALGFMLTAAVMAALLGYHALFLPRVETPRQPFVALLRAALRLRFATGAALLGLIVVAARRLLPELHSHLSPVLQGISTSGWISLGLLAVLLVVLARLPDIRRRLGDSDSFYSAAFVNFLEQAQVGRILAFVILFRTGESFLLKMRYAFLRDVGMSMEQYALASGTIGVVASFTATLLGGYLISRHGLRRWIWPFVLAQNTLNLLYFVLAGIDSPGLGMFTAVIALEAFGAGLGTAVFMVYLMGCCRENYRAAHMAILTALMSVSFTLAGVASGFLAEALGFANYFAFTFVATIPAMALIPFIPHLGAGAAAAGSSAAV